jgi:hypothetical protein
MKRGVLHEEGFVRQGSVKCSDYNKFSSAEAWSNLYPFAQLVQTTLNIRVGKALSDIKGCRNSLSLYRTSWEPHHT